MTLATPRLEVSGVSKRFGSVLALEGAGAALRAGRVTAIVGENGAGKSTLAKILAGVYRPDSGRLFADGVEKPFGRSGVELGFVPQTLSFVGAMSLLENHMLGAPGFWLRPRAALAALGEAAGALGVQLPWRLACERLSFAERQLAEIASALARGLRVLLLDEPTSALGPLEVERLIGALGRLTRAGVAVGLVTHRVREVLETAHEVVVLRGGRVVHAGDVAGLSGEAVARLMVGERAPAAATPIAKPGPARLSVEALQVPNALEGVSFVARAGEILGIAGVAGAAQPALAEAVAGLRPQAGGRVRLDGVEVTHAAARARRAGLAYIPETRAEGAPADAPASLAASLLRLGERAFTRAGLRRKAAERALFADLARRFDVRPADPDLAFSAFSGGNQQKLLVARELEREPAAVVAHGPTQGLDLAAAAAIRAELRAAARAGAAVVVISTDLDELLELSSRVIVLAGGRNVAEFDAAEPGIAQRIGQAMTGATSTGALP